MHNKETKTTEFSRRKKKKSQISRNSQGGDFTPRKMRDRTVAGVSQMEPQIAFELGGSE